HLADIYRVFLREDLLELHFKDAALEYSDPPVLNAPPYRDLSASPKEWRKNISFDFGAGLAVHGFAALREPGSTTHAGFSLFRRKRLIEGSGDEKYRPKMIFGNPNSYRFQRLFGELHLEGFEVSHTKDGFQWDENEQSFLELLREHLEAPPLSLLDQAEGWRSRAAKASMQPVAESAVAHTAQAISQHLPVALPSLVDAPTVDTPDEIGTVTNLAERELEISFRGRTWKVRIEVTDDQAEGQWLSVGTKDVDEHGGRHLTLRLAASHP